MSPARRRAYVGLGSNVEPARHLGRAVAELAKNFDEFQRSPVCISGAAGYEGPDYWNLCAAFTTALPASELISWLKAMEERLGRARSEPRFAPKTIDADLLLLGDVVSLDPPLPHPEILTTAYVLGPLAMLSPGLILPGGLVRVGDLWQAFESAASLRVLTPDPLPALRKSD